MNMKYREQTYHPIQLFHFAMDHAPEAIFWMDSKGDFLYVNEQACHTLEYSREELLTKTVFDVDAFYTPEAWPERWENLKQRKSLSVESVHINSRGERIPVEIYVNYLEFMGSEYNCAFVRDIRDRKAAEANLKENEEKLRALVENANEAIFIAQDDVLKFVNPKTEEMIGYSSLELQTMPFIRAVHEDDRELVINRYRRRLEGEILPNIYPFRIVHKDGTVKWAEINTVKVDWEGRPATLNFLSDISQRRMAEEKIQASLREKEVMLREIHHRVKNNLQIISSLLRLQAGNISDPVAADQFRTTQNRIRSMAMIHESLYGSEDLSRIDFSRYSEKMIVKIYSTYQADSTRIKFNHRIKNIYLDIHRALPCGQILNELVSNALRHAFPAGRRGILEVGMDSTPEGQYQLTVRDNGIGLPAGLDVYRTETLGFQLVADLVNQLSGKLIFRSEKGTEITICF